MTMIEALAADAAKLSAITGENHSFQYQLDVQIGVMMTAVTSSNLRAIGWREGLGLVVEFNNDGVYAYPGIVRATMDTILEAESVGKSFHAEVKSTNPVFVKLQ
jgi:hypothetical protein